MLERELLSATADSKRVEDQYRAQVEVANCELRHLEHELANQ